MTFISRYFNTIITIKSKTTRDVVINTTKTYILKNPYVNISFFIIRFNYVVSLLNIT